MDPKMTHHHPPPPPPNPPTHSRPEVDDPVQLDDEAGLSLLEAKVGVYFTRAGSQHTLGEAAGLPDAHVALQVAPLLVLRRLS